MTGFLGLVGDTVRLLWDLLALNASKSFWIARGRRGHSPCQHPSDSGRAGETGCDACHHLRDPGRLRAVCPLLVQTQRGWQCSVGTAGIKPFWARTLGIYACLAFGLYLGAATAAFGGLRWIGYSGLEWWHVAWPGSWQRIPEAQSRSFLAKASTYLDEKRYQEAQLALSSAVQSDPDNLPASVLLGQIWYIQGNLAFAEQAFEELGRKFPAEKSRLELVQHDTLVAIGEGRFLADFALTRTHTDRSRYAAWVEAMLFGLRLGKHAQTFYSSRLTEVAKLAPAARRLVAAEALIQEGKADAARADLSRPFEQPWNPTYARLHLRMLIRIGAFREAGHLLNTYGRLLGDFERELLRLELNQATGDVTSAQADLLGLVNGNPTSAQLNSLCALLVQHPDRRAAERMHAQFKPAEATLPTETVAALWLAASLAKADPAAAAWAEVLQARNVSLPPRPGLDFSVTELTRPGGVPYLINTVQLPRPVIYALALRIQRK